MQLFVSVYFQEVITQKPLHRISYCADDHNDKRLFTFIAKEEECKSHKCFALTTEREVQIPSMHSIAIQYSCTLLTK